MRRSHEYVQVLLDAARAEVLAIDRSALATPGSSGWVRVHCLAPECARRPFIGLDALRDHAEAVHTFDDIRRLLSDHLRETFGRTGDYNAEPPVPGIWVWIDDLATDWVVFSKEEGNDSTLLKADYSIDEDNAITLGDTVEVVRRTVYDPVK